MKLQIMLIITQGGSEEERQKIYEETLMRRQDSNLRVSGGLAPGTLLFDAQIVLLLAHDDAAVAVFSPISSPAISEDPVPAS